MKTEHLVLSLDCFMIYEYWILMKKPGRAER